MRWHFPLWWELEWWPCVCIYMCVRAPLSNIVKEMWARSALLVCACVQQVFNQSFRAVKQPHEVKRTHKERVRRATRMLLCHGEPSFNKYQRQSAICTCRVSSALTLSCVTFVVLYVKGHKKWFLSPPVWRCYEECLETKIKSSKFSQVGSSSVAVGLMQNMFLHSYGWWNNKNMTI